MKRAFHLMIRRNRHRAHLCYTEIAHKATESREVVSRVFRSAPGDRQGVDGESPAR